MPHNRINRNLEEECCTAGNMKITTSTNTALSNLAEEKPKEVRQEKDTVMLEIRTNVLPVGNHTTLGRALRIS